jgi:hypothetical protein
MMTKKEETILEIVAHANSLGALAGLRTDPNANDWMKDDNRRFVRRLSENGLIVFVPYTKKHGSGWALAETENRFL